MNTLPKGWTITRYPGELELRDEHGATRARIPAPNTPMTIGELLDATGFECQECSQWTPKHLRYQSGNICKGCGT